MAIDRTAKVHRKAEIGQNVDVGAYSVIGEGVRISDGTRIADHVVISGLTEIGAGNIIYHGAVLGSEPQVLSRGDMPPTRLLIGDNNVIREYVTMNTGTEEGGGITIVGNNNYLMACSHVAHDCVLEDDIVMANCVLLAGHVKVERCVNISGGAAVHHFVTIGEIAFVGGLSRIMQDVAPYMMLDGPTPLPRRVNVVGLRRHGVSEESIDAVEQAFRIIYRSRLSRLQALKKIKEEVPATPEVRHLAEFLRKTEQRKKGRYLEGYRT